MSKRPKVDASILTGSDRPATEGRSPRRRRVLALLALAFVGILAGLATAALAAGPDPGTLRYEWSIGDRYGVDANGDEIVDNHDGITDLTADKAFVQTPTYDLTFDTCASPAVTERNELIKTYKVTLTGPETVTNSGSSCKVTANVTKLGSYTAKVELLSVERPPVGAGQVQHTPPDAGSPRVVATFEPADRASRRAARDQIKELAAGDVDDRGAPVLTLPAPFSAEQGLVQAEGPHRPRSGRGPR